MRRLGLSVVCLLSAVGLAVAQPGADVPRTPWGTPDLQGVWDVRTITPLQRPADLAGKRVLTDEEAAEYETRAQERRLQRRDRSERCLVGLSSGPPFTPGGYNSNVQLFQTPDYVVILTEMVHQVRVVPLDERPHLPPRLRQWHGNARGRWDGDTLVVDSTNFTDKTGSFSTAGVAMGSALSLRLVERFTRVDADTLLYEFTVDDPVTFTRPFTAAIPIAKATGTLFEYACHEGNYAMINMLAGARERERAATESPDPPTLVRDNLPPSQDIRT